MRGHCIADIGLRVHRSVVESKDDVAAGNPCLVMKIMTENTIEIP